MRKDDSATLMYWMVVGIPSLGGLIMMLFYGAVVTREMTSISSLFSRSHPVPPPSWDIVNLKDRHFDRDSFDTIVEPQKLTPNRSATIVALMDLAELRGSTPVPATSGERRRLAEINAPNAGRAECEAMRAAFADQCVVDRVSVNPMSDYLYEVTMRIRFTNKEAFGSVQKKPVEFFKSDIQLTTSGASSDEIYSSTQKGARRDMYRAAASSCRQLRRSNGNCGIVSLYVHVNQKYRGEDSGLVYLTGSAELGTLRISANNRKVSADDDE